jgi:hypothetical protein
MSVDHIDENPRNNDARNLRWMLQPDNSRKSNVGERNSNAKLTARTVQLVRSLRGSSFSCSAIARKLGVSCSTICRIQTGESWTIGAETKEAPPQPKLR